MKIILLTSTVVPTSLFGLGTADAQDPPIEKLAAYHETVHRLVDHFSGNGQQPWP